MEPDRQPYFSSLCLFTGFFANLAQVALLRLFLGNFYGTELHLGTFLAVWLTGIAGGAALAGRFPPSSRTVLAGLFLSSWWAIAVFPPACSVLPMQVGGYLPFFPMLLLLVVVTFPLTVSVGMLIPSILAESKEQLGRLFSLESLGSFLAGLVFSVLLGGKASAIVILLVLPIFSVIPLLFHPESGKHPWLLWPVFIIGAALLLTFADPLEHWFQDHIWQKFHPGYTRIGSWETPYQSIQIGQYAEQKSVFLDGAFAFSWPDTGRAESAVHSFLSAISSPTKLLLLGNPPPDWLLAFSTYPGLETVVVDIDPDYSRLLRQFSAPDRRIRRVYEDPRRFLALTEERFSGIMVIPSDPATLLSNRLFTAEAFREMKNCLEENGVVSVTVSGNENYLGPVMEQTILSMHRTLQKAFPKVFAIPGDPIVFWAAAATGTSLISPKELGERFRSRQVPTKTFLPESFVPMLFPFRVQQLAEWLQRKTEVAINRDHQPVAFARQVRLWDIFSGSRLSSLLETLEQWTFRRVAFVFPLLFAVGMFLLFRLPGRYRSTMVLGLSGSLTGMVGLLAEIVLILAYQNRNGAMFQMASLFFGLFMLGLSCGAGAVKLLKTPARFPLPLLKGVQILLIGWFSLAVWRSELQTAGAICLSLFSWSFLQGFELILLDCRLQTLRLANFRSAGFLFAMDNLGAVGGALASGLWIIPVMGLASSLHFAMLVLGANLLLLLFGLNQDPETAGSVP
jgi:predicted membrane-bound spermidine synthase